MPGHEFLGKIFTALKQCSPAFRPDHRNVPQFFIPKEKINNALYQRSFRPNHNQMDILFQHESFYSVEIHRINLQVGSVFRCSRVARRNIEFCKKRTLSNFPCKGMFTASGAEDEYIHSEEF